MLGEIIKLPITTFKKEEYSRHRGSNSHWTVYTYKLVTKIPDSKYGSYEGLNIDCSIDTKYGENNKNYNTLISQSN